MDSKEFEKLPNLVDGKDIFLRRKEKIKRAVLWTGEHVYVSNQKKRGKTAALYPAFRKPEIPSDRKIFFITKKEFKVYPEDA